MGFLSSMGIQVEKLLAISFFMLLISTLTFCEGKKATVKVVGILHDNQSTNSNSSLGTDVLIICNEKTRGNGGIDENGRFNVTLSAEIENDTDEIDGCYARLQSNSGAPCNIQEPQAATVKVLSNGEKEAVISDKPSVIKFSPLDCQSAFFWPFPNLTFLGSPPSPPEYTAPPSPPEYTDPPSPTPDDLPPAPSPAENSTPPPQPSYDPPAPSPSASTPPAQPPTYLDPSTPATPPPQAAPPLPVYRNPSPPSLPSPAPPPLNPTTPAMQSTPPPLPSQEKPAMPSPSATIPGRRRPSPIPRAPPIPRLPLTPSVPRKYFNPSPNSSKSKPPHLV